MEQLDLLWRFQEMDRMLDEYNKQRKKLPMLNRLNQLKRDLLQKQDAIAQIGKTIKEKSDLYYNVRNKYEDMSKTVVLVKEQLENINDLEELKRLESKVGPYIDEIANLKSTLKTLKNELEQLDGSLVKIRDEVKVLSDEYNGLKKQYEEQTKIMGISVGEIKKERQELKGHIDKTLLDKYQYLRKHKHLAVALIDGNKCSGCNMALPSLVVTNVKEGKNIIECENCGRILYYKESVTNHSGILQK